MTTMTASSAHPRRQPGVERLLVRSQLVAGTLFALFVLVHISNVLVAPFGIDAFNGYQRLVRSVYQQPAVELLVVIGPLVVHAVCGVWLAILRRGRGGHRRWQARAHTWAGVFLLLVIVGHVLATRGASFFFGVFPEFEGLAFSLWFAPWYFYPYYFLLAVAGFYHASNGLLVVLRRFHVQVPTSAQLTATGCVAVGVTFSLLALGGFLFDTPDPTQSEFAELGRTLFGLKYE